MSKCFLWRGGGGRGRADCFIFLTQVFSFDFYDGLHLKEAMLLKMRTIVLVAVVYFCLAGSKASLLPGVGKNFLNVYGLFLHLSKLRVSRRLWGGCYPLKFLKSLCSANNEFSEYFGSQCTFKLSCMKCKG